MSLDPAFRLSDFAADKVNGVTQLAREHNLFLSHFTHGKTLTTTGIALGYVVSNSNLERHLAYTSGLISSSLHPSIGGDTLTVPAQVLTLLGKPVVIEEKTFDLSGLSSGAYQLTIEWWHALVGPTTTTFPKSFGAYTGVTNTQNKLSSTELYSRGHLEASSGVADEPLVTFKVEAERYEQVQYRLRLRAESALAGIRSADLLDPSDAAVVESPLPGTYQANAMSPHLASFEVTPSPTADSRAFDRTFHMTKLFVVVKDAGNYRLIVNDARASGLKVYGSSDTFSAVSPADLLLLSGVSPAPIVLGAANFQLKTFNNLTAQQVVLDQHTEDIADLDDRVTGLEEGGAFPVGSMMMFAGSTPPAGWLICDGSAKSRTTYAALFTAIGVLHGPGDSVSTFNLPDLRGRFPTGVGTGPGLTGRSLAEKGGSETHTLTINEIPPHDHGVADPDQGEYGLARRSVAGVAETVPGNDDVHSGTEVAVALAAGQLPLMSGIPEQGGGLPHNNVPPFYGIHFIIKH